MIQRAHLGGVLLIGAEQRVGEGVGFRAHDPAAGVDLPELFPQATSKDVDDACRLAANAFEELLQIPDQARASFLEDLSCKLAASGDELIHRAMAETGLPEARLRGERDRTVGQLRLFAREVCDGGFRDIRIDRGEDGGPDLRSWQMPLGPVAVFSASNFPLAFSVAGGDTASALAAGCPVIVRAHPAHPGVSEIVGKIVQESVRASGLPHGTFSMLQGLGHGLGRELAMHDAIAAVAFTGSRSGGLALMQLAAARTRPIPVYAEMSSINPVILLPGALEQRSEALAHEFVASLTLGAGQFCTNPGLVLAVDSPGLDRFIASAGQEVAGSSCAPMLTPRIGAAYAEACAHRRTAPKVRQVAAAAPSEVQCGHPALFETDASAFLASPALSKEVFGPASLVVRCSDLSALLTVIDALEGQLTGAIHFGEGDTEAFSATLPRLERKVGRVIANGFGTGVAVSPAMVHGGPFPATSEGRSTSVGTMAARRFLRPVCYQDIPDEHLPTPLRHADGNQLRRPSSARARST